nr:MAG TPA: hypothetical protein [Caudoviricetes sp.]
MVMPRSSIFAVMLLMVAPQVMVRVWVPISEDLKLQV